MRTRTCAECGCPGVYAVYDTCEGCVSLAACSAQEAGVAAVYLHAFARVLALSRCGERSPTTGLVCVLAAGHVGRHCGRMRCTFGAPLEPSPVVFADDDEVPEHDNAEPHRRLVDALTREGVYVPGDQAVDEEAEGDEVQG